MSSNKPRIATYTDHETIEKFNVISAMNGMSMSKYLEYLVKNTINEYESKNGKINVIKPI